MIWTVMLEVVQTITEYHSIVSHLWFIIYYIAI